MMSKAITIYMVLCGLLLQGFGQIVPQDDALSVSFEEQAAPYPLHYLYRGVSYDYLYDDTGNLLCDIGHHVILKANNEAALGTVNKIYIPTGDLIEVRDIKSRTISRDGRVVELDQSNIKEIADQETQGGYRIFAVEGAEVGGEVEYSYVMRTPASTFVWQTAQYDAPTKTFDFQLTSPEHLLFDFHIANYEGEEWKTDTLGGVTRYRLSLSDVPGYVQEPFAAGEANKIRIEGKLSYNTYTGGRRLNTFSDAGKKIFRTAHTLSKVEEKEIAAFIKRHRRAPLTPMEQLIHYEHEVKIRLYEEEYASDKVDDLLSNRFGQGRAFLKLFVAILEHLDIDYEIVTTCERDKAKFNPNFDNWKYLDDFLIYLPAEEKFLAPHHSAYRYGSIPPELSAQKGLFVKNQLITDFEYPVSRIADIPAASHEKNTSRQEFVLSFSDDLSHHAIDIKFTYTGDEASNYKTALHWTTEQQRRDLLGEVVDYMATGAEIDQLVIKQADIDANNWNEPFIVSAELRSPAFLERAGPALLFKLGDVIGPQPGLYEVSERKFEVEQMSNKTYYRNIRVELPKGYAIHNLDDIRREEVVTDGDEEIFVFRTDYTLDGNVLNVSIEESYRRIFFPSARFEEFRRVINAAADWNKVILVLRPNG